MKAAWNAKTIRWQNAGKTLNNPLSLTGKEAKDIDVFLICDWCQ